jgi:hypothetical protein
MGVRYVKYIIVLMDYLDSCSDLLRQIKQRNPAQAFIALCDAVIGQ